MALTWKDAVATVLVAAAGIVTYAKLNDFSWPLLGSWQLATFALLVIGFGTCIIAGSDAALNTNAWTIGATVLGIASFVLAVAGMIVGNKFLFLALATDIALLWLSTTIHHITATGA